MANTKISQLTATTTPTGSEELVYALNNANGKMTLNTMKGYVENNLSGYATTADLASKQDTLVSATNIKTINNSSILGSGNLDISGGVAYTAGTGIDITGGVISATGGGGVTELNANANIWELSEGIYVTDYDLYYKSGSKISVYSAGGATHRQMIFVEEEGAQTKGFLVYNVGENSTYTYSRASFGYSKSSSDGEVHLLKEWDASLKSYAPMVGTGQIDILGQGGFTQIISDARQTSTLQADSGRLYAGVTYTIIVSSIYTGDNYLVTFDNDTVTNPLNINLPMTETKPCVITLVATDDSHAIITGCTIGA